MPQKRPKNARNPLLVSHASVALYRVGLRTQPCWDACHAAHTINCEHEDCKTYYEALHALNMAFNVRPHEPSPLYPYDHIRSYDDNTRTIVIKQALDAALQAEIAQESKP